MLSSFSAQFCVLHSQNIESLIPVWKAAPQFYFDIPYATIHMQSTRREYFVVLLTLHMCDSKVVWHSNSHHLSNYYFFN